MPDTPRSDEVESDEVGSDKPGSDKPADTTPGGVTAGGSPGFIEAEDVVGETGPAAAMAVLIAATSAVVTLAYLGVGRLVERRTQAWKAPAR